MSSEEISRLEQLRDDIEKIEISYDYEKTYTELRNTVIDYMNETQDWDLDYLFEEFIDYETAEEIAKRELENGGLIRLYYFLGDANLNNPIFKIDGYGNLTDIDKDDLSCLKNDIIDNIYDKLNNN